MNQRGFITSIYLKLIAVAAFIAVCGLLYWQVKENGKLAAANEVQRASLEEANRLRTMAEEAIKERDRSLTATHAEINRYRANLKALEAKYATLLNTVLPNEFIASMCQLTGSRHGTCLPFLDPPAKPAITGMDRQDGRGLDGLESGSG